MSETSRAVTLKQLADWCTAHPLRAEDLGFLRDGDDSEDAPFTANDVFTIDEAKPAFTAFLRENGLFVADDKETVVYDPQTFPRIRQECDALTDEYEGGDTTNSDSLWSKYGLGGDDDVDYHGGYIQQFLDLLEAYDTTVREG